MIENQSTQYSSDDFGGAAVGRGHIPSYQKEPEPRSELRDIYKRQMAPQDSVKRHSVAPKDMSEAERVRIKAEFQESVRRMTKLVRESNDPRGKDTLKRKPTTAKPTDDWDDFINGLAPCMPAIEREAVGQEITVDQGSPRPAPELPEKQANEDQPSEIEPDRQPSQPDPQNREGQGMNHKQRKIIQWGAVVIAVMLLCPPWKVTTYGAYGVKYGPIFAPPYSAVKIAIDGLAVQIAATFILLGVAVFSYASPKEKDDQE